MLRFFFLLLPCLALAQYPKAMDFSKLYQGKLDSVVVIHRTQIADNLQRRRTYLCRNK